MPLDGQITAYEKPDLSRKSVQALAWILRHREEWPKGFEWDFSNSDNCAIGLAVRRWGDSGFNGMGEWTRYVVFYLGSNRMANVTPEHVADRLDDFAAGRMVRE